MRDHLDAIATAADQLRPHVRPEADHLAGALAVAIEQARAALPADDAPAASDASPSSSEPAA